MYMGINKSRTHILLFGIGDFNSLSLKLFFSNVVDPYLDNDSCVIDATRDAASVISSISQP